MFGINRTVVAVAVIVTGLIGLWTIGATTIASIRRHAAADRDVIWERKLRDAKEEHAAEMKALQDGIDTAAAAERANSTLGTAVVAARALALENELNALKSDPVFPQSIARELRR
jgi:cell division protein FtsB